MKAPILIVDDESKVLKAYERNLSMDFDLAIESNPTQAVMRLEHEGPFSVLLTDYNMPGMNGNDLLQKAKELSPDTVRIMLTGYADLQRTITAVNDGSVFRFLTKPCALPDLMKCLEDGVRQYELVTAEKMLLDKTLNGSIQVLVEILSIADHNAFSLAQKRRKAARGIAKHMGISDLWPIEIASLLSDVGMVTLPDGVKDRYVANKDLSEFERKLVKKLPELSSKMLNKIPRLEEVSEIILYQAHSYGGQSQGVDKFGNDLPVGSRIIHVLNDYFRIVGKGEKPRDALKLMSMAPEHYDPKVLSAIKGIFFNLPSGGGRVESQIRKVGIDGLKVGQVLKSDVYDGNGMLILKADQTLGTAHLQRIKNFSGSGGVKEPILVEG